jgi:hypothetical protein
MAFILRFFRTKFLASKLLRIYGTVNCKSIEAINRKRATLAALKNGGKILWGKFWREILEGNFGEKFCGKFWREILREILAGNFGDKFW